MKGKGIVKDDLKLIQSQLPKPNQIIFEQGFNGRIIGAEK
jgi:hypothetical protein